MSQTSRRPSRTAIVGGVVALAVIVAIVVIALVVRPNGSDLTASTSTVASRPAVIKNSATVTGITGVVGGSNTSSNPVAGNHVVARTLVASGTFACATPGTWQLFADLGIKLQVAEPAANATCGDKILDLPAGSCSTTPCSSVPADWRVVQQAGVTPQVTVLVIAPTGASTGQFLCIKDSVAQNKQILPLATTIEQACASATSGSIEIPYVPIATSDIPFVPPPASVDIPASTS